MNDRRFLLYGIPVLALLALVPRGLFGISDAQTLVVSYAFSLVYTLVFWLGDRALWRWLLRRYPTVQQTRRRLWYVELLAVLYTAATSALLNAAVAGLLGTPFHDWRVALREFGLNMVPTTVVLLLYESWNFFLQWEQNVRRAEQLQSASQRAQLEALQQQLDPHFLFNSLNTLAALVEPDNEPAQHFVEQLADVYRYVLLSRDRSTVPLREELAFVDAYVALQKARLRESFHVRLDVPAAALEWQVAPLSVQLLIENALKHNEASRQHPLQVQITAESNWLTVRNARRARRTPLAPGTGTGLRNIRERYALLAPGQPVRVEDEATEFVVRLPLLAAVESAIPTARPQ